VFCYHQNSKQMESVTSWANRSTILNRNLLMVRLTLHLPSKLQDSRCLEERLRRASSINGSHHGRSSPSRPNIVDITMHDVNIEETKCEILILALSPFSWSG